MNKPSTANASPGERDDAHLRLVAITNRRLVPRKRAASAVIASAMVTCLSVSAAPSTPPPDQQALDAWHASIDENPPEDGASCHAIHYPETVWKAVPCGGPAEMARIRRHHPTLAPALRRASGPLAVPSAAGDGAADGGGGG